MPSRSPGFFRQTSVAARPSGRAFSLIEVIAAVVIFAIGMISVLGLYGPVTKAVAAASDTEAAARVADAVRARLETLTFDQARALIQEPSDVAKKDGDGAYNPNDGARYPAVLFGKLDGEVGVYDPAENRRQWYDARNRVVPNAEKFFEIDLIRQPSLSPAAADDTAPVLVYLMRVRWPAFVLTSPTTAVQSAQNTGGGAVPFDHGRKQVLYFSGALAR